MAATSEDTRPTVASPRDVGDEPRHFAPYGSANAICDETVPRRTPWDSAVGNYATERFTVRWAEVTCRECLVHRPLDDARVETTTATVEDAYRLAYDVMRHHPGIWHNSLRAAVEALADAGLLRGE